MQGGNVQACRKHPKLTTQYHFMAKKHMCRNKNAGINFQYCVIWRRRKSWKQYKIDATVVWKTAEFGGFSINQLSAFLIRCHYPSPLSRLWQSARDLIRCDWIVFDFMGGLLTCQYFYRIHLLHFFLPDFHGLLICARQRTCPCQKVGLHVLGTWNRVGMLFGGCSSGSYYSRFTNCLSYFI